MLDRYKLHQFYQGKDSEIPYSSFRIPDTGVDSVVNLEIEPLPTMWPKAKSDKAHKDMEGKWIDTLPKLKKVKALSLSIRIKQDFFEAICQMPSLERLTFLGSPADNISSISKLKNLSFLKLYLFTRLKDISPLLGLKKLKVLSIDNCFKVENYPIIGQMTQLVGLELCGDTFAPRKLPISSLKPFEGLKNLKHLDLSAASVIDKSYESILQMKNLERLDMLGKMPKETREKIKSAHKNLKAGFFVDYDFENKRFYDGKHW